MNSAVRGIEPGRTLESSGLFFPLQRPDDTPEHAPEHERVGGYSTYQ